MTERPTTDHVLTHLPILRRDDMSDYHYAAITYRDRVFVICTEGVGWEVTQEKPWEVDGAVLGPSFIADRIAAESTDPATQKPLESWIRTFGARLESNFHTWSRRLDIVRDDLHEAECGTLLATASRKDRHERVCEWCGMARAEAADETPAFA